MSVDASDKCPSWFRTSTHEANSPEGRYILGGRSQKELADYGRFCILKQLIVQTFEGCIDVSDPRRMRSLAADLGYRSTGPCMEFLQMLVEAGAIDRECFESAGIVSMPHLWNGIQSFQAQASASRRNGAKGGRPRKQAEPAPEHEKPEEDQPCAPENAPEGEPETRGDAEDRTEPEVASDVECEPLVAAPPDVGASPGGGPVPKLPDLRHGHAPHELPRGKPGKRPSRPRRAVA